jgi:magnesium transporter
MLMDLKFSIATMSITAGTFVAALYGMNLKNFLEESDIAFWGVSAWCTVFGFMVAVYGLTRLRRVQRVSMWGHGSARSAGWGLGAWGGRSTQLGRGGGGVGVGADCGEGLPGVPMLRPGESLGELIQRERSMARKLAKTEAKAEEATKVRF